MRPRITGVRAVSIYECIALFAFLVFFWLSRFIGLFNAGSLGLFSVGVRFCSAGFISSLP